MPYTYTDMIGSAIHKAAFETTDVERQAIIDAMLVEGENNFSAEQWCSYWPTVVYDYVGHQLSLLDQAIANQAQGIVQMPGQLQSISGGHGSGSVSWKPLSGSDKTATGEDLARTYWGQRILARRPKRLAAGYVL